MLFGNLDKRPSKVEKLNEGNFISSDFTGIFDSTAQSKLNALTLGKLFEGLDIDTSMHSFIATNAPSISGAVGPDKEDTTVASDLLKLQLAYIQVRCDGIERDFESALKAVLHATEEKDVADANDHTEEKIHAVAGPEGVASVVSKIDELVKNFKAKGGNLSTPEMKAAFNALNRINTGKIVSNVTDSIMESAASFNHTALYKKIDAIELVEIDEENATSTPVIYAGKTFSTDEMLKSMDPIARMAAFYDLALSGYPFGRKMAANFGATYENLGSTLAISALKQFVPSIDSSAFSSVADLLDDICTVLVNRAAEMNPEEDAQNVFVPALQAMWVSMVAIVAMKLINYNLSVGAVIAKKEVDAKASTEEAKKERVMNLKNAYDTLEANGFFDDTTIYWAKSGKMAPDQIKNVNYFFNALGLLPESAIGSTVFSEALTQAIEKFQAQSKLAQVDGKIGPKTRAAMEATAKYISKKYNVV